MKAYCAAPATMSARVAELEHLARDVREDGYRRAAVLGMGGSSLAPELFSVGGEQFGRSYDPSELLDDHGATLKIELRHAHTWGGRHPTTLMPYVFADGGRVWARTTFPGFDSSQTATSAGAGLRLSIGAQLSGFVEVAKPLDRIVEQERNRDLRIYAGLSIH